MLLILFVVDFVLVFVQYSYLLCITNISVFASSSMFVKMYVNRNLHIALNMNYEHSYNIVYCYSYTFLSILINWQHNQKVEGKCCCLSIKERIQNSAVKALAQ